MSEQSTGDISHNKLHQLLESLQASKFPPGLLHRLRLDETYREAFVMQARMLDVNMNGEELTVEYRNTFKDFQTIVRALKKSSPYAEKQVHLLKDETLFILWSSSKFGAVPSRFPLQMYAMPLYKKMTLAEVHDELERRQLLLADAVDALCLATRFATRYNGMTVFVPGAIFTAGDGNRQMLSFSRNGNGDPVLQLANEGTFLQDDCLLVKRRLAAFM